MSYIEDAVRSRSARFDSVEPDLLHGIVGIATEAGEMLDALKKHIFYGKQIDLINLQEELGDLFWYMALLCNRYNWTFEQIQAKNIAKLKARYPEKFTEEKSLNRDLEAERKVLESEPDVMVHEMEYKNGGINMMLEHPVFGMLLTEMLKMFDQQGAQNYLEFRMAHPERGEFVCTIQRKEGKTPAQVIEELKKENAHLKELLESASDPSEEDLQRLREEGRIGALPESFEVSPGRVNRGGSY